MERTTARAVFCAFTVALLVLAAVGSCVHIELTTGDTLHDGLPVTDAAALHRNGVILLDTLCTRLPPRLAAVVTVLRTEAQMITALLT